MSEDEVTTEEQLRRHLVLRYGEVPVLREFFDALTHRELKLILRFSFLLAQRPHSNLIQ